MSTIAERVEAGAAWLDANRPGWVDRINLETLDLGDPCRCVLGQEFRDFGFAPESATDEAEVLGFDRDGPRMVTTVERDNEYDELTDAWRDYITARRAA